MFPLVDRSGQGNSNGVVIYWKQRCRKNWLKTFAEIFFSGNRGDLMGVEDSEDEGVVVGVR